MPFTSISAGWIFTLMGLLDDGRPLNQGKSLFWYVVTGRHPSGIVVEEDWTGPQKLFDLLHRSLLHDLQKRPQNGSEFFSSLEGALST